MPNVFNAVEIIDMGIQKEKRRRDFYAMVAKKFKNKKVKELFTNLAAWEETHISKFSDIRDSAKDFETVESYQGELEAYIRALVDDKLYNQVTAGSFAKIIKSPIDAIQRGIGFEKDSILFFTELLKYMTPNYQEKISVLIDEEKQHIVYLAKLRRSYK